MGRSRFRVYRPVNPHERARVEGWYSAQSCPPRISRTSHRASSIAVFTPPLIFRNLNAGRRPLVQNPAERIRFLISGVWSDGNLITTWPASASSRITMSPICSERNRLGPNLAFILPRYLLRRALLPRWQRQCCQHPWRRPMKCREVSAAWLPIKLKRLYPKL